jgi:DNA-binding beta-propeller fold protein YncE
MESRRPFILTTNPFTAQVQFFDGETYDLLAVVETPPQPHEICITPDKSRAYISIAYRAGWYGYDLGKGHELVVLDLQQRKIAEMIDLSPDFGPHGLALDEQRGLLYITCESRGGCVLVMDEQTHSVLDVIPTEAPGPHWLVLLEHGKKIYTANKETAHLSVIDTERRALVGKIPLPNGSDHIAVHPGTGLVYLCDDTEPLIHVIDPARDTLVDQIRVSGMSDCLLISPDGKRLFVSHRRGFERLRAQGILASFDRRRLEGSATPRDCIRVVQHLQGSVTSIDLQTYQESRPVELSTMGGFMEITPDQKRLFVANLVIDTESMTVIDSLEAAFGIANISYVA